MPDRRPVPTGRLVLLAVFALSALLAGSAATYAQEAAADFDAAVTAARDEAQATIDAANIASEEGFTTMTPEQQLTGPVAEQTPVIAAELRDFATFLEAADVPADRAEDVAAHIDALGELAASYEAIATAAAEADEEAVTGLYQDVERLHIDLAADVSPDYFDIAYLTTFRNRFESFKGLTEADRAYLEGVRGAGDEFARRNAAAGQAVFGSGAVYASAADMMRAFYEAGAGEAFPAVEAALLELTPTERFADEHAWYLREAADDARIDRRIGEAARDGDAVGFLMLNARLALNPDLGDEGRVYRELDPAFGALIGGPTLRSRLDPSSAIARSEYGTALFDTLRNFAYRNATAVAADTFSFPGTTIEIQLQAVANNADLFRSSWTAFADELRALEPPPAFADDHARILAFADEHGERFFELLDGAEAGDTGVVQPALEAMRESYCDAARDRSGEIAPATSVYFDATFDICR